MRRLLIVLALLTLLVIAAPSNAQVNAASCLQPDVQTAITAATQGQTVNIPAGICTWTTGITISGKGINVKGAGSGRIIAISQDVLTIATGSLTVNIIAARADGTYPLGPTVGQTLRVFQTGARTNWMQGTVSSFSSNVLVINITSTSGTSASYQHHWSVATIPQTVLINNSTTASLFSVTEDTAFHTTLSGFKVAKGTGTQPSISFNYNSGGQAIIVHDCWMEQNQANTFGDVNTNRGLIYNCSFDASPFSMQFGTFDIKSVTSGIINSWTTLSTWGTADTTGQGNFYIETNDYHAYLVGNATDDNGRLVFRYNFLDDAGFGTHGADTSPYGQRYVEYYNNRGSHHGWSDGSTFNMANGWILLRGGSLIVHDNNLDAISGGSDFAPAPDLKASVFNLREGANNPSDACWGAGTSGGALYHAPRQVGMGRVTGTGLDGKGRSTDETTYVGDSEPLYLWNNNRTMTVSVFDFSPNTCTNPDTAANYIVSGRDYFNGTAKPSYTPFQYPHPLTGGQTANPPNPPTNLIGSVSGSTVSLSWTGSTGTPVPTGYTLYRGTVHGGPYTAVKSGLTSTSTTDTPANGTYFYVTAAFVGGIVSSITGNGTTATVICISTCSFATGTVFTIAGDSQGAFNGTFSSTGQTNSNTFTFASSTNASGTGGGAWPTSNESSKSNEVQATVPATLTVSLLPATRTFASQIVGTTSASQSVTLTNTSGAGSTVTITSKTITGANSGDFSSSDNCPSLLLSGTSCTFNITFSPTAAGSRVATLAVADNAAGNPQTVALSGTGVAQTPGVSLNPTSLNFGDQTLSTTSTVRSIILTNTGSGVLTITSVVASGDFAVVTVPATNCGTTLASLATCSLNVTFTPTATGGRTGAVTVTDNAAGSPHVATLSGNGITTKCTFTGTVTLSGVGSVCQ